MVTGIPTEGGGVDYLLIGAWSGAREQALFRWKQTTPDLHDFEMPDYHRLQLEYWLYKNRARLMGRVMDVGVYNPRTWVGDGYFTLGFTDADVAGDLTALPMADASIDAIICTEVLEHCADPFAAMREMERVLKLGGLLLVTSPFLWPYHGIDGEYPDFWRFTHEGWALLLKRFVNVKITECAWTTEGAAAYDQLRRWEGFGFQHLTRGATGYLCEGTKGAICG